jgi:hypothetical protein
MGEMTLPSKENLKAKLTTADRSLSERMDKLKASLKQAYKSASIASKASHQKKKSYDQRAKTRSFEGADFVYLFNKARKLGLSKKFHRVWTCPFQVSVRITYLKYIIGKNGRKQVARINRLKPAHGSYTQASKSGPRNKHRAQALYR